MLARAVAYALEVGVEPRYACDRFFCSLHIPEAQYVAEVTAVHVLVPRSSGVKIEVTLNHPGILQHARDVARTSLHRASNLAYVGHPAVIKLKYSALL